MKKTELSFSPSYKLFIHLLLNVEFGLLVTFFSAVDSGGAGVARAPPEFGGSEKGRSLISALLISEFSYYYEHPWI